MATVNTQDNPIVPVVGSRDADGVVINSQIGGFKTPTFYQIENITTGNVITINTDMSGKAGGNIISVDRNALKIILEARTKYRVRTKARWLEYGHWVNFTTRDKRYQSPDAITSLTDDTDSTAVTGGNRTIVVTNNAKATEVDDSAVAYNQPRNWGSVTITNTDTIFNDGQLHGHKLREAVTATANGASVINVPSGQNNRVTYTNRGATIDTRG